MKKETSVVRKLCVTRTTKVTLTEEDLIKAVLDYAGLNEGIVGFEMLGTSVVGAHINYVETATEDVEASESKFNPIYQYILLAGDKFQNPEGQVITITSTGVVGDQQVFYYTYQDNPGIYYWQTLNCPWVVKRVTNT